MLCSAASRWRSPWAAQRSSAAPVSSSAGSSSPRARWASARLLSAATRAPGSSVASASSSERREVVERVGGGAAAGGERAEQVVGLAERARVAGLLGQCAGALGELGGARRVAAVVRAERQVGGDPCAGREVVLGRGGERGLEVRGRERPLAPPVADLAEPVLDRADLVAGGEGGGRLVGGERGAVVALQRLEVPDRGVQRARLRVADRERRAQMLERLRVGEQGAGVVGGAAVGGRRPRRRGRRAGGGARPRRLGRRADGPGSRRTRQAGRREQRRRRVRAAAAAARATSPPRPAGGAARARSRSRTAPRGSARAARAPRARRPSPRRRGRRRRGRCRPRTSGR